MRRKIRKCTVLFAFSAVLFIGCETPFYGLILKNESGEWITGSRIQYGERLIEFGNIVTNSTRGYGTVRIPIPDNATVYWEYEDGKKLENTVKLKTYVSKARSFQGSLTLRLKPNGSIDVDAD